MTLFRRHSGVDADSVRPRPAAAAKASAFAEQFASEGRVSIEDVLPGDLARAIASALPGLALSRESPDPRGLGGDDPGHMFYEAVVRPHRACRRACAPVCAMAASLEGGSLVDFLRIVTRRPLLCVRSVSVRAYVKGSHVSRSAGMEAIWYGTPGWDVRDGGLVRFPEGDDGLPRFGTMHVVEGEGREVTLVTQHRPLYVVRALLGTR